MKGFTPRLQSELDSLKPSNQEVRIFEIGDAKNTWKGMTEYVGDKDREDFGDHCVTR